MININIFQARGSTMTRDGGVEGFDSPSSPQHPLESGCKLRTAQGLDNWGTEEEQVEEEQVKERTSLGIKIRVFCGICAVGTVTLHALGVELRAALITMLGCTLVIWIAAWGWWEIYTEEED